MIWGSYGTNPGLQSLNNDDYKNTVNICRAGIGVPGLCGLIEIGRGLKYKRPDFVFPEGRQSIK
jgi:hypothetical protein